MGTFAIDQKMIDRATALVPEEDLVGASRDRDTKTRPTDLLLILSTPRSGSTLLSDLVDRVGLCCPAEYFQPYEYLPILASRWNCVRNGVLDDTEFARKLKRYRTAENGWLGVKLHPTHLPHFVRAKAQLDELRWHGVHLIRRDQIAQAISYHIADKTKKWSSAFQSHGEAAYDYSAIRDRLQEIIEGNTFLLSIAATFKLKVATIYYEDLVADPVGQLQRIPGIKFDANEVPETGLGKQGDARSQCWAERFAAEYSAGYLAKLSRRSWSLSKIMAQVRMLRR